MRRKHGQPPAGSTKRIAVDFPQPLLLRAERAIAEMSINRSDLIRKAVEQYLEALQRAKLERELMEGYVANASQAMGVAQDLANGEWDLA